MHMLLWGESWLLSHLLREESVEELDERTMVCSDAFAGVMCLYFKAVKI